MVMGLFRTVHTTYKKGISCGTQVCVINEIQNQSKEIYTAYPIKSVYLLLNTHDHNKQSESGNTLLHVQYLQFLKPYLSDKNFLKIQSSS